MTALAIVYIVALIALLSGLIGAGGTVRGWPWLLAATGVVLSGLALAVGALA